MILNSSKRISIIKPVGAATSKSTSPFLITNGGMNMMHYSRKSFLNRDSPILEKLASLSKAGTENDAILNTAKGKGNYVFVATEKKDVSHIYILVMKYSNPFIQMIFFRVPNVNRIVSLGVA